MIKHKGQLKSKSTWLSNGFSKLSRRVGLKKSHYKQLKVKIKNEEQKKEDNEQWAKLYATFTEHWDSKEKKCECCGTKLWGENKSIYHHHVLSKNRYKEFAYDIRNLLLVCAQCHACIENAHISDDIREKLESVKHLVINTQ